MLSRAIGLSPPALIKRFGSKERLLFRALLPSAPPRWTQTLTSPPGDAPVETLVDVLCELCDDFRSVGPALAALRMSPLAVSSMFPSGSAGPAALPRRWMTEWLTLAGCGDQSGAFAEMLVGAAEARGFLTWVGPQMLAEPGLQAPDDEEWARQLVWAVLPTRRAT